MKATLKLASLLIMSSMLFTSCGSKDNAAPEITGQNSIQSNGLGQFPGYYGQFSCMNGATRWTLEWYYKNKTKRNGKVVRRKRLRKVRYICQNGQWVRRDLNNDRGPLPTACEGNGTRVRVINNNGNLTRITERCVNNQWQRVANGDVAEIKECSAAFVAEHLEVEAAIGKFYSAASIDEMNRALSDYEGLVTNHYEQNKELICKASSHGRIVNVPGLQPTVADMQKRKNLVQISLNSECSDELKSSRSSIDSQIPVIKTKKGKIKAKGTKRAWRRFAKKDSSKLRAMIAEMEEFKSEYSNGKVCSVTKIDTQKRSMHLEMTHPMASISGVGSLGIEALLNVAKHNLEKFGKNK